MRIDRRLLKHALEEILFLNKELKASNDDYKKKWFFDRTGNVARKLKSKLERG